MTMSELTLQKAIEGSKKRDFRASDFLTSEEMDEVRFSNAKGKKKNNIDPIDAYAGEILGRFGYDAYRAWKAGEIENGMMVRYIKAERAREAAGRARLAKIIVAAVAGANHPQKGGKPPKTFKIACKMLEEEEKIAKGGI